MIYLKSVDSTNAYLKKIAYDGVPDRTAVVSLSQTAGRGRVGRPFFSPPGTGLYMSVLLRSAKPDMNITTMAAVAVCRAIEKMFGTEAEIKWVNDVLINRKKVCGILTEAVTDGNDFFAVLGIGINVFTPSGGFPSDLKDIAAAVSQQSPDEKKIKALAALLLEEFYNIYENGDFFEEYAHRCVTVGKKVTAPDGSCGTAISIDRDMSLVVCLEDGSIKKIHSGEVGVLYG